MEVEEVEVEADAEDEALIACNQDAACGVGVGTREGVTAHVQDRAFHAQDFFYLQLHLSRRCNLRCKHCYIEDVRDTCVPPVAELQPSEIFDLIKQLDGFVHCLGFRGKIYFTGGEPLLDGRLLDYIAEASRRSIVPMILSNGTLIDHVKACELHDAGARIVQVSVDGVEGTHDFVRGKGTFSLATRALDACHDAGLATIAMLTLSKLNALELPRIIDHCLDHHVTSFAIGRLVPEGAGLQLWNQMLSPRELKSAFKAIASMQDACKDKMEIGIHDPLWLGYMGARAATGCTAGKSGLCVTENGDIMACRRINTAIGNIRNTSILGAWFSAAMNAYRREDRFHGKCSRCKRHSSCGGCRAVAKATSGDVFGGDPQCFRRRK